MKQRFLILIFLNCLASACQQRAANLEKEAQILEVSCGSCNFGLKADDCALALKIDGKAYFVDGTGIDDHGDAHAKDGFCNAVRKASVKGKLVSGRFKASYFKLLP
jgi:hypothetical protein